MTNYEHLYELLLNLDEYIGFKQVILPNLYLFGGTACILGHCLDRATSDFDILDTGYSPAIMQYTKLLGQVDFLDLNMTTIDLEYAKRAEKIFGLQNINIYTASCEDIITAKIGRYSPKDIEDIGHLIKNAKLDLLNSLLVSVSGRKDLSMKLLENYHLNVSSFRKRFLNV